MTKFVEDFFFSLCKVGTLVTGYDHPPADHEVRFGPFKHWQGWGLLGKSVTVHTRKGQIPWLLISLPKWLLGPWEGHHRTGEVNKKCPVLRLCRVEGPDRKLMQLLSLVALLACTRLHKVAQGCTMLHSFTQFYWLHIENNVPRAPALQVQKVQIYWSIE